MQSICATAHPLSVVFRRTTTEANEIRTVSGFKSQSCTRTAFQISTLDE